MDSVMFSEIKESLKQAVEYSEGKRSLKTYTIKIENSFLHESHLTADADKKPELAIK